MKIYEHFCPKDLANGEQCKKIFPDGRTDPCEVPLLTEHQMKILVNDILVMDVVCTPEHLTELALGALLSRGTITDADDMESLYLSETGSQAKVFLREGVPFCPGEAQMHKLPPACPNMQWVFRLAKLFAQGSPLHRQTVGTHSCILAVEGEAVCCMEDLGRHNALDKALGYGLLHDVPLSRAMVYISGRVPADMAAKVIRAGVPVLVSKAVPTLQSIALAREYGLNLFTSARPDMARQWQGL